MRTFLATLIACAAASVGSASAANLVTNGGFETGDFTGWTLSGETNFDFVCHTNTVVLGSDCVSEEGLFAAALGPARIETLSQTIVTIPGQTYTISFAVKSDDQDVTPSNSFAASFGGAQFFSETNTPTDNYVIETFSGLTASSASTVLQFKFVNVPGADYLDAVSASQTPEPASLVLFAGALLLFGTWQLFARRRSTRRLAASSL